MNNSKPYALKITKNELIALDAENQTMFGQRKDIQPKGKVSKNALRMIYRKLSNLEDWEIGSLFYGLLIILGYNTGIFSQANEMTEKEMISKYFDEIMRIMYMDSNDDLNLLKDELIKELSK